MHKSKWGSKRGKNGKASSISPKDLNKSEKHIFDSIKNIHELDLSGATKSEMPSFIKPMLATLVDKPFSKEGWIFEVKWDGWRAIAQIKGKNVRLYSRNDLTFNNNFPEITTQLSKINFDTILDGEIVALDSEGRPKFQLLQNYQAGEGSLAYFVFDILYFSGYDLRDLRLSERKLVLKRVLPKLSNVLVSDEIEKEGTLFFKEAVKNGLEGIIAKNLSSKYISGRRTLDWLKIKAIKRQEVVIGGFTTPRGARKKIGALIIGVYRGDDLIYVGHTGSGFDDQNLDDVFKKLRVLTTPICPFKVKPKTNTPAVWVRPELMCEVEFSEWTSAGLMRQAIFKGIREDKKPKDVKREIPLTNVTLDVGEDNKKTLRRFSFSSIKQKQREQRESGFTHLDKVYFPKSGITKGEVIHYYEKIAGYIFPYIKDRPHSLYRNPDGIEQPGFFQKDIDFKTPKFVQTIKVFSESEGEEINYIVCKNIDTLLYMVNLGCIEINPWLSKVGNLESPDFCLIDLDPEDIEFDEVVKTALVVKEILEKAKIKSFIKTSGKTGLHILVPTGARYNFELVREFAKILVTLVCQRLPKTTSIERNPTKRKGKVYLDYLQNRVGQTMAAPYSVRPLEGAPVSTPLRWDEVKAGLNPADFNIKSIFKRLNNLGDLFDDFFDAKVDIETSLKYLA